MANKLILYEDVFATEVTRENVRTREGDTVLYEALNEDLQEEVAVGE